MIAEKLNMDIRWCVRRDLKSIVKIDKDTYTNSWSEENFITCLRKRSCIGMVAEVNDNITGYMIYELFASKLHIIKFTVNPECRNMGVGAQMLAKLISKLNINRKSLTIYVDEGNLVAQKFFSKNGFKAVNIIKNEYFMRFSLDKPCS